MEGRRRGEKKKGNKKPQKHTGLFTERMAKHWDSVPRELLPKPGGVQEIFADICRYMV